MREVSGSWSDEDWPASVESSIGQAAAGLGLSKPQVQLAALGYFSSLDLATRLWVLKTFLAERAVPVLVRIDEYRERPGDLLALGNMDLFLRAD